MSKIGGGRVSDRDPKTVKMYMIDKIQEQGG